MDIFQIVAVGIVGGILAVMIKKENPTFAVMVSLAVAVLIFIFLMPPLAGLITLIANVTGHLSSGQEYVLVVVQIIGIAYVAEFGAQICNDAGEGSIASKIELAGKVLIMGIAAPIIISLVEQVIAIIPS
ncbi:MAG: stage III sporulation protein AD [Defluviitaleaceae bacterium]|nr:stage III sporulation protein AD [Defluviitaleaceae bacterium]